MKILLVLMSFILISCKSTGPQEEKDLLANLITIQKSGNLESLISSYGPPTRIEKTEDISIVKYIYDDTSSQKESFIAFVDPQKEEVKFSSTMFWKSDDDYELLKMRFGNYSWVEKYVPTSLQGNPNTVDTDNRK